MPQLLHNHENGLSLNRIISTIAKLEWRLEWWNLPGQTGMVNEATIFRFPHKMRTTTMIVHAI